MTNYLAIDLGAESGRAITGSLIDDRLTLREVHRFGNGPVRLPDGLHWDVLHLWSEVKDGMAAAIKNGATPTGVGVDTWGVDFGMLDKSGDLIGNPFHYRDSRTNGLMEEAFKIVPRTEIFSRTGNQFLQLNTLYQLISVTRGNPRLFDAVETFLTIPDLLNYWLSGVISNEFTITTTTQCYDLHRMDWAKDMLEAFGIPGKIFGPVSRPGTVIGSLLKDVAEETGCQGVKIILPACHDTGSAVAAVPTQDQDFAWISSGTWSIMGAEVFQPIVSEKALECNITNEGGVSDTWRLSKNIMGLWLVQECRRFWRNHGEDLSYDDITRLAAESPPFLAVIDPDAASFFHPGDMPEKIRKACAESGQKMPHSQGEIIRVALESLALKYRRTLQMLEDLIGKQLSPVHIIGGGSRNRLMNQFTADCTGKVVVAGPVEATATGNVLMQAIALGQVNSLMHARSIVRNSFDVEYFQPASRAGWDEAYEKFMKMI